jgi:hypothetical protein
MAGLRGGQLGGYRGEDGFNPIAQLDQNGNRDNRDEGKNEGVFHQGLALPVFCFSKQFFHNFG